MRWPIVLTAFAAAFAVVVLAHAGDDLDRLTHNDFPEIGGYV